MCLNRWVKLTSTLTSWKNYYAKVVMGKRGLGINMETEGSGHARISH